MTTPREMLDDCLEVAQISAARGGPGYSDDEKRALGAMAVWVRLGRELGPRRERELRRLWNRI